MGSRSKKWGNRGLEVKKGIYEMVGSGRNGRLKNIAE